MLKICLVSDNHGDLGSIRKILNDNPACDYYFHAGDCLVEPFEIAPFVAVEGNNDWNYDYPKQRIFEIGGHRILLMHGHSYCWSMDLMVDKAKQEKCDVIFFGHTHSYMDKTVNGIRIINPGSCFHNRDMTSPSYARVYLMDDGKIKANRIDL